MSRNFVRASGDLASYAGAVVAGMPMTVSAWYYPNTLTSGQTHALASLSDNAGNEYVYLHVMEDGGSFKVGAGQRMVSGGTHANAFSTASPSVGTWNHAAAVFGSTTSRAAYLDGANKGTNATNVGAAGSAYTVSGVGAFKFSGSTHHADGRIGEVAWWNVVLTDDEIEDLAAGVRPALIRPESLVAYWRIKGNDSPEPDEVGSADLTLVGPPLQAPDPPMQDGGGLLMMF